MTTTNEVTVSLELKAARELVKDLEAERRSWAAQIPGYHSDHLDKKIEAAQVRLAKLEPAVA